MTSIENALLCLEGVAVGDAFGTALGEGHTSQASSLYMANRELPPQLWRWTDDTHMALSIVETLSEFEAIDQDFLAKRFATRFAEDPYRGYAAGAAKLLTQISNGQNWQDLSPRLFNGGSYGNGAAMRVAPIGAYFQGQSEKAAEEAQKSAVITHAHIEGQAGAIAVAVATAIVADPNFRSSDAFLAEVAQYVPAGDVRDGIQLARGIPKKDIELAYNVLGTGWNVSAQDTVPFCLWCVSHNFDDFESALWITAGGEGDRDTTCAIVGGIMAVSVGDVPRAWGARREGLPSDFRV